MLYNLLAEECEKHHKGNIMFDTLRNLFRWDKTQVDTKPYKKGTVNIKIKRNPGEDLSEKEYKATLDHLKGPFGRMR